MPNGRVAVFTTSGVPFDVVELPTPEIEPGGLLVKNTHAVICGSDLHGWRGDGDVPIPPIRRLTGHEFTGVVHSFGEGVGTDSMRRPLREGDRVAFPFFNPCNRCYMCVRGEHHACPHRGRWYTLEEHPYCDAGMADYYYLPPGHYVFKVPDELPTIAVPPVNCALSQVLFGLERAKMGFGDTVVIQGAGGLGIYATAIASEKGASSVIVIDGQQPRLDLAMKCGATDTVSMTDYPTPESSVERVKELTHGVGADVVVEVVGIASATLEGLDMVRVNGKYIDIGNIGGGSIEFPAAKIIGNQTQWLGTVHYDPWIIEEALQFLVRVQDRIPVADVVSHQFPLEQINEAFEFAEWHGREGGTTANRVALTM
ncbi:MAG: alcohol dehydrogenase catalytic domain-containing protein [Chloroflexi bacterium]|nr:alcohol dehydrogenase catalytic domain-containing protein [Chloroflexota bacterium]